ncbi:hypothetical protein ACVBEJ_07400 [Porticoccus sp. GXU_MW_L64]
MKKIIATLCFLLTCASLNAESRHRDIQYRCINGVTQAEIPGTFDRREKLLIELGGGHCKVIPIDLYNGHDGDISAALERSIDEDVIYNSIHQARDKFGLQKDEFLYIRDVESSGFKYMKYVLVFENWKGEKTEVKARVHYWKNKIKSLDLLHPYPHH